MMKIYVGGLPYDTDESQLSQIFASYGEVASAKVISDRETGRSKGFGFVEMADDTAAKRAIEELQGAELGGRSITVNEARPMEQRDNRGGGGGRGGYSGGGGGGRSSGGGGGRDGGRRW
ncbi:MAG TPA: RNA-binding protein [Candidatus Kapabacteria bacterium]|jgi:RNA recognition motif-containing protein|nr:RNA-binding protein [Candidatus Kapabacteria bacterium]